jgi:hypothetical protein
VFVSNVAVFLFLFPGTHQNRIMAHTITGAVNPTQNSEREREREKSTNQRTSLIQLVLTLFPRCQQSQPPPLNFPPPPPPPLPRPNPSTAATTTNHLNHTRSVLGYVRHPFIVGLKQAFQTRDKLFFVLDYCAGGELFFHLGKLGTFPEVGYNQRGCILGCVSGFVMRCAMVQYYSHSNSYSNGACND